MKSGSHSSSVVSTQLSSVDNDPALDRFRFFGLGASSSSCSFGSESAEILSLLFCLTGLDCERDRLVLPAGALEDSPLFIMAFSKSSSSSLE